MLSATLGVTRHYKSARPAGADSPGGLLVVLPPLELPGSGELQAKNCRTPKHHKTPTSISYKANTSLCIIGYREAFYARQHISLLEPSMKPSSQSPQSTDISENSDTEAKMRRALGLERITSGPGHSTHVARPIERSATDRPKSRFVQDGEVPVVMIRRENGQRAADPRLATGSPSGSRLEAAETALRTERHARETAERRLAEAKAAIRDLQTQLGHAVLVRDEARADAQRVENEKQTLERALAAEQHARQSAEQRLLDIIAAPPPTAVAETKSQAEAPSPAPAAAKSAVKARSRRSSAPSEPQPVKWWIKPKQATGRPA